MMPSGGLLGLHTLRTPHNALDTTIISLGGQTGQAREPITLLGYCAGGAT